jgi:hypothetical protein
MNNKITWELVWFDMESEKKRETIETNADATSEDAVKKAYLMYGGPDNAPASLVSATKKESKSCN